MEDGPVVDLRHALQLLDELEDCIRTAPASHFEFHAPVLDRQGQKWVSDGARGMNKFAESVALMRARVELMAEKGFPPKDDPLPSIEGLITVWKAVLSAEAPVTALRTTLKVTQKVAGKDDAFLDVIARGGEEWVKIYSKKVTALMVELREQDSMINSDWDSESEDEDGKLQMSKAGSNPASKPTTPRNSLVDLGESLLQLAECSERPPGARAPRVTLRITRIAPDFDADDRIQLTFEHLRNIGINLIFGDMSGTPLSILPRVTPAISVRPGRKICLDPTAMMALCSDLLHHPLPLSREAALDRFFRPRETLQDLPSGRHANGPGRGAEVDEAEKGRWRGQSQNSRELVKNLLEEMDAPLIDYIRDVLASMSNDEAEGEIEWWSTKEAVQYLQEILGSEEVVGIGEEQRRMRRLVGLEEGDFFEGSRYAHNTGKLSSIRIKVFDRDPLEPRLPPTSFHCSLAAIAQSCLGNWHDYESLIRNGYDGDSAGGIPQIDKDSTEHQSSAVMRALPNFLKPNRVPVPKVAQLSVPFPIVSLITLARGAKEGMTTLMCGNVVFRDLFGQNRWKVAGWVQGNYEVELGRTGGTSVSSGAEDTTAEQTRGQANGRLTVDAAVWMLPYRSLGEGKRVKFEQGDYSYPNY